MGDDNSEIRIAGDKTFRDRLEVIKEYYNIKTNAEMVRMLVSEKYHEITEKQKTNNRNF